MKKTCLLVTGATLVVVVACIGSVFLILSLIFGALKAHPVYRMGMDLVKNDPKVVELFGSPVEDGFFVAGTIKEFRSGGDIANLEGSISGPKARGAVFIFGRETDKDGVWQVESIDIDIDGKPVLSYKGSQAENGFYPVK